MELTGKIIAVMPAQSGISQRTGNAWKRQDYVIEVPGQYPRKCAFSIFGEDRIKQFDLHQGEENITVQFDIDAREYNGRWYNEVRAYNVIRPYVGQPQAQQPVPQVQPQQAMPQNDPSQSVPTAEQVQPEDEKLPF